MATLTDYHNSQANKSLQQQLIDATLKGDTNAINQVSQAGQQLYKSMGSPVNDNVKPQAPTFDMSAITDQINKMYQSQLQSQQSALQRAQQEKLLSLNQRASDTNLNYNQGINKINNSIQDTRQNAVNSRNAQGAVNNQNVLKLREAMASMGLGRSGTNAQNLSSLQNQHMSNLNNITMQENQAVNDYTLQANDLSAQRANELTQIDEQIDLLKRQGVSENNELLQRLESEKSAQLIDLMKYGDNRALQLYNTSLQQYNTDRSFDYQTGRDNVLDNRYNTEWNYQTGRDNIADQRYNQQWNYNVGRDNTADQQWQKTFDSNNYWKNVDQQNWLKQFNASLERAKASSGSSSGGGSSSYTKTQIKDATLQQFDQLLATDHPATKQWLDSNSQELINNLGYSGYKSLVDKYQKAVEEWNKDHPTYEKRLFYGKSR